MSDSTIITDVEHNYSLSVPNTTPSGQPVEIIKNQHEGMHQVHAYSPDMSEVYFEIVSYPRLIDHAEAIASQQTSLTSRAPDADLTLAQQSIVRTLGATEFHFKGTLDGRWKVRRFLFLDSTLSTYRIIYDPRSAANKQILDSLMIGVESGA